MSNYVTLKLIINATDKNGYTPYILAKLRNNLPVIQSIEEFADKTANLKYLEIQTNKLSLARKQQQSSIIPLAVKIYN